MSSKVYSPVVIPSCLGQAVGTMERFFNELDHTLEYKSWFWGHFHETFGYDWDNHKNGCIYRFVADLEKIMNEGIRN